MTTLSLNWILTLLLRVLLLPAWVHTLGVKFPSVPVPSYSLWDRPRFRSSETEQLTQISEHPKSNGTSGDTFSSIFTSHCTADPKTQSRDETRRRTHNHSPIPSFFAQHTAAAAGFHFFTLEGGEIFFHSERTIFRMPNSVFLDR